jgi:invasion protein IalB
VCIVRSALAQVAFGLGLLASPALGDWQTRCEGERCQLVNELLDNDKKVQAGVLVKEFDAVTGNTGRAEDQRQIVVVVLPLGIYIPAGVTVQIDALKPFKAELIDCRANDGCRAAFDFTMDIQSLMRKGRRISFMVIDAKNQRQISFNFPLVQFTSAYREFAEKTDTGSLQSKLMQFTDGYREFTGKPQTAAK